MLAVIRAFAEVLKDPSSKDNELIFYSLAHLDGILEDSRTRVKYFIELMNDFKNKLDLIKILIAFINRSTEQQHRDIASHILVLLVDSTKFEKCGDDATHFLYTLTQQSFDEFYKKDKSILSLHAYTFALMTLLKTNQLAKEFTNDLGFKVLNELLERPCLENAQIAYNVVTILWILSYHEFSHPFFEDYRTGVLEKVSKVLDFFSWEKIVRIMLMLFDNLKDNSVCQEHLSDIDALSLVEKLQNRHWVDEDINKNLKKLEDYFDENQKVFSSIDKFRNQVKRGQLRWGPCHTTEFWAENFILFDRQDNLHLIKELVDNCLKKDAEDRVKAVACFDLGEFSRFFPNGK